MPACVDCKRKIEIGAERYLLCGPEGSLQVCVSCGQGYPRPRDIFDRLRSLLVGNGGSSEPRCGDGGTCGGAAI